MTREKRTIQYLFKMKKNGEKMPRTVLYDYPMAVFAEMAGIDIINVGDSIAMTSLGFQSTLPAKLEIMVEHAKAVRKGAPTAFIMGDMPFLSYQVSIPEAMINAGKYIVDAEMDAVKVEGGCEVVPVIKALTEAGIPVIAHTGLTPQSIKMLGSYRTQGRDANSAIALIDEVKELEQSGAIAIVIESVPLEVSKIIYERTRIPILGTGCGPYSDSPGINAYDLLGFYERTPKFAKQYAKLREEIMKAFSQYVKEVKDGDYPTIEQSYNMLEGEYKKLEEIINKSTLKSQL